MKVRLGGYDIVARGRALKAAACAYYTAVARLADPAAVSVRRAAYLKMVCEVESALVARGFSWRVGSRLAERWAGGVARSVLMAA